ncbi:MAG: glycosyltransferase family 9 protein [Endomicrobiales bacterium]|jgi:ADP-heptose:LPS heptosyltransferase
MNILIIKPSSLGDIIQANPTIVALKRAFPSSRISWLVFDRWAEIISLFTDVDECVIWRRDGGVKEYTRVIREVRRKKFDVVIDLQGLLRSAMIARLSGAKTMIGVPGMKEGSWLLIKEAAPAWRSFNAVWRSLETVRHVHVPGEPSVHDDVADVDMHDLRKIFHLSVPGAAREEVSRLLRKHKVGKHDAIIAIVPTARGKGKQWSVRSYNHFIEMIRKKHPLIKIVLLDTVPSTLTYVQSDNIIDFGGKLTLHQLAAVLSLCKVAVGADTGPMHLAAALGTPVVMMFGGSDSTETAPVSPVATILKKEFSCAPCRGKTGCVKKVKDKNAGEKYPCLEAISPGEVFKAVEKWIQ